MSVHSITAEELVKITNKTPDWLDKLTEPLEVEGYADFNRNHITHLSPLVSFKGKRDNGDVACFGGCDIEIATGTFHGFVNFRGSSVEKIKEIKITTPNHKGEAADFGDCHRLDIATGTYPGSVDFSFSSISKIEELTVTNPNDEGVAACFDGCDHLLHLEGGTYNGCIGAQFTNVKTIKNLNIIKGDNKNFALMLNGSVSIEEISGVFPGAVIVPARKLKNINNLIIDGGTTDKGIKLFIQTMVGGGLLNSPNANEIKEQAKLIFAWMKEGGIKSNEINASKELTKELKKMMLHEKIKTKQSTIESIDI
jgi:hypothetical protein